MKKIQKISIITASLIFTPLITNALVINTSASSSLNTNILKNTVLNNASISSGIGTDLQAQIDLNNNLNTNSSSSNSAKIVGSESELAIYNNITMLQEHRNVVAVNANPATQSNLDVSVTFRHNGLLFGLFPISFDTITTVSKDDNNSPVEVDSSISLWSYLVSDDNYDRENVENRIKNNIEVIANANLNASADAKAKIATAIVSELEVQ